MELKKKTPKKSDEIYLIFFWVIHSGTIYTGIYLKPGTLKCVSVDSSFHFFYFPRKKPDLNTHLYLKSQKLSPVIMPKPSLC